MTREIIIKELREYFYSTKFVVTFLLSSLLLLVSMYVGIGKYLEEEMEYNSAQFLESEMIESQPDPSSLALYGFKVYKPPQILSIFVDGVKDAVGRYAEIKSNNDPRMLDSTFNSKPLRSIFGNFDLILVAKFLLSLTAILFTYNAISGEKERGTLKAIVSNHIPRYSIICGKILGGFLSLIIPLMIPLIIGLIVLSFNSNTILSGEEWVRSALIIVAILAYVTVFYLLGIFISSLTRSSIESLFILILIWIVFIFIIPQGSVIVAEKTVPTRSVFALNSLKQGIVQEKRALREELMRKWIDENKPVYMDDLNNYAREVGQKISNDINTRFIEIDRDHWMNKRKQQTVIRIISRFSPSSALQFSTMSFARTGIVEQERFQTHVSEYKKNFEAWAKEKQQYVYSDPVRKKEKQDFSDMPKFDYTPESLGESVVRALPDIATMILMILFLTIGSVYAVNRYDVR